MKYFCTEDMRVGSSYHEFQKGKSEKIQCWKKDSILLSDLVYFELGIEDLFYESFENYDYYGVTYVDKSQWDALVLAALDVGGDVYEAVCEADLWAKKVFESEDYITIYGM